MEMEYIIFMRKRYEEILRKYRVDEPEEILDLIDDRRIPFLPAFQDYEEASEIKKILKLNKAIVIEI